MGTSYVGSSRARRGKPPITQYNKRRVLKTILNSKNIYVSNANLNYATSLFNTNRKINQLLNKLGLNLKNKSNIKNKYRRKLLTLK